MTRTNDGAPDPVTDVVRAADLRARAPQSAIPTQGGHPLLPPPRSGPPPMGPMIGPPSGPARRSPLLTPQGRPTPQHPSGEQPPLDEDEVSVPLKVRLAAQWRHAREVAKTPAGRWSLICVATVVQVFLLFSAVMWWVGSPSAIASSKVAPMTWTGIVYDVGLAGVNLRADPTLDPAGTRDTAGRGSRLAVQCGQTGDEVQKGTVHTATWLKTTDGLFVSMLYVRVPDRQSIPSCADSTVDAPLLALSDPTDPNLPPPPGATLGGSTDTRGQGRASDSASGARSRAAATPGPVRAPALAPAAVAPAKPRAPIVPPAVVPAPGPAPVLTPAPKPESTPKVDPPASGGSATPPAANPDVTAVA